MPFRIIEEIFFLSLFSGGNYKKNCYNFFLNIWYISPVKSSGSGTFYFGKFLTINSISLIIKSCSI